MLLRRCGLQYRGVWKNALHQIRGFLRYSCWKACRETPGRQKTHCHCSPQLLTTTVLRCLFTTPLALSLLISRCRLPCSCRASVLTYVQTPAGRILSASGISASSCVRSEQSIPFSNVHPSAVYRGTLYIRSSPRSGLCKVDVGRDLNLNLTYNFPDKPFETFETRVVFNKRGIYLGSGKYAHINHTHAQANRT